MFGFKKTKITSDNTPQNKPGLFASLKTRLAKTRASITTGTGDNFPAKKQIDEELFDSLKISYYWQMWE